MGRLIHTTGPILRTSAWLWLPEGNCEASFAPLQVPARPAASLLRRGHFGGLEPHNSSNARLAISSSGIELASGVSKLSVISTSVLEGIQSQLLQCRTCPVVVFVQK